MISYFIALTQEGIIIKNILERIVFNKGNASTVLINGASIP